MAILMRSKSTKAYRAEQEADLQSSIDNVQRQIEENLPDDVKLGKAQGVREGLLNEEEAARKAREAAMLREHKAADDTRVARKKVREIQARIYKQDAAECRRERRPCRGCAG